MNKLEEELHELNITITTCKALLHTKKNIRYDDWCKLHEAIDTLTNSRDKLLQEKFRGDIL